MMSEMSVSKILHSIILKFNIVIYTLRDVGSHYERISRSRVVDGKNANKIDNTN